MSSGLARRIPSAIALPARTLARQPRHFQVRFQSRATATEPTASTTSTTPPPPLPQPKKKKGAWRGTALRWGAAGGAVWWYLNSPVFAEEPEPRFISAPQLFDNDDQATVAAIVAKKRAELQAMEEAKAKAKSDGDKEPQKEQQQQPQQDQDQQKHQPVTDEEAQQAGDEAQGAFNPETGEINWDCPCLGGMAQGPCGPEFKEAFSCFVFSTDEPKGMNCIDKFQGMQECFRRHPEVYADELRDDEPAPEGDAAQKDTSTEQAPPPPDAPKSDDAPPAKEKSEKAPPRSNSNTRASSSVEDLDRRLDARGTTNKDDASESEEGRHVDATDANTEKKENEKQEKQEKPAKKD